MFKASLVVNGQRSVMQLQGNRKQKTADGSSYLSWQRPEASEETGGYPIPISFIYFIKTLNPFFDVLPYKFLKVNSSFSFVSIQITSCHSSLYLQHSSNTCWTVSGCVHCEHRPVGCFPILLSVCLSPVCPILSRVKIISSLQFLPHISLFLTCWLYTVKISSCVHKIPTFLPDFSTCVYW